MSFKAIMALAASFLVFFAPAQAGGQGPVRITALILQTTPEVVGGVYGSPDGKGGIASGVYAASLTSQFPEATVLLKLGGPAGFDEMAILDAIGRNFTLRIGDKLKQKLSAVFLGKVVYTVADGHLEKNGPPLPSSDEPHTLLEAAPGLNLDLILRAPDGWILSAKADIPTDQAVSSAFLDQTIRLRSADPILIGAPYVPTVKGLKGRFIYWVALLAESM